MLNVPSQSFPAPSSQQRVVSGGRSKVPLKQGRSLMDWIRLTKSGKDLTGFKGRLIEVTEEELKKHNKKEDCWICIRGYVYNVSPYMEYHPGGEDELMRAAGSDGTDLFDQVHRWVNYESMLKECLIGRMAVKPAAPKDYREEKRVLNGMLAKTQVSATLAKEGPNSPSYDWFQTDSLVTIVIYTKQKDISLDSIIVDHQGDSFRAETIIKDYSYFIHIELSHEVEEDFSVRVVENVGKIEIVLKKKENTSWKCLGHPLEKHNLLILKKDTGLHYRKCQLVSKEAVTQDTKLFCLMLPPGTHLQVPVGHHVYLKVTITGTEIVKPYTPVSYSLFSEFKEPDLPNNKYIYFLIKIYPAGLLTPELDHLQIGDFVFVSGPEGNFKKSRLQELEDLFLVAAGTGFTPMVKILNYALSNIPSLRKLKLMFFNKAEDDIIWRGQLEKLAFKDKRFDVEYVLSAPTSEWSGKQGQISPALLSEFLKRSSEKSKVLLCICGPTPFIEQGITVEMSAQRLISNRTFQQTVSNSDYTWEYEYYEIGPVSFDGLKAHKYSIVIGFWVGLAVFVIFMFFVLTLLTKTGAPHQDNIESSQKRFRMNSFVSDFGKPLDPDKVFSRQGNEESRSLFHCYINEVEHLDRAKACHQTTAVDSDAQLQEAIRGSRRAEEELNRLMKFDIPNFVNTDQNSFGEDDLLISEPPIVLENKPVSQTSHKDLD